MNNQDAIKMLNQMLENCEDELEFGLGDEIDDYTRKGIEVYKLSISALEKQIPKKRYIKFPYSYCPVCNENITDESPNYCPECGQAIDWEGEDE